MDIKAQINNFLQIAKDSGYNIGEIYHQAPMAIYTIVVILIVILLIILMIKNSIKNSKELSLLHSIDSLKTFDEFIKNFEEVLEKLPKANNNFIALLNSKKDHFLKLQLESIQKFSIKDKIDKIKQLSSLYDKLSKTNINNKKLLAYYNKISKELSTHKLQKEIDKYSQDMELNDSELDNIIAVVEYANLDTNQENTQLILETLSTRFKDSKLDNDLEALKLFRKLTIDNAKQIFQIAQENIDKVFKDSEQIVSIEILDYLLASNDSDRLLAYNYISTLKNIEYFQELYTKYFDKESEDFNNLDINLAFIANSDGLVLFSSSYKTYIDNLCTNSWRDPELLEYVNQSPNIVNVIGHEDSRKIIERVDHIKQEAENKKVLDEALETAKRAELIAQEAKELALSNSDNNLDVDDIEFKEQVEKSVENNNEEIKSEK